MEKEGFILSYLKIDLFRQAIFRFLVVISIGLSTTLSGYAQQGDVVRGKITGSDASSLPGVNVVVKGTTQGVISDPEGNYSISVKEKNAVLVFSFIGYQSKEIAITNQSEINVVLDEDVKKIDEVVIVGYGSQKKKDLTGSISRVSGDELIQASTASFSEMMQGKVAGVQISQSTGSPGGNVNVMIRGISSITGGTQPLYVVDGFPISTGSEGSNMLAFGDATFSSAGMAKNVQNRINPLASINPSDIESIEILKDASATAIYGSRGSNGVIIITTKRGSSSKSKISVDVSYGVQTIAHKLDMMNAQEYAQYVAEGRDNAYVYGGGKATDPNEMRPTSQKVRPEFRNPSSITESTDWQDQIFRSAPVANYQLSASGGNDKIKYLLSGGFFDQTGILLTSDYQRFNVRSNIDAILSDKVKLGSSVSGSYSTGSFPNTEGHYGTGAILTNALAASPTIPVYDAQGNYYFNQADVTDGMGFLVSPLVNLHEQTDNRKVSNVLINNYLEYKVLDGLTFKTSVGINYGTNIIKLWKSSKVPYYASLKSLATGGVSKMETMDWLNENTLNYKHIFNKKHSLDALIGFTAQKDSYDRLSAGASNFPTDYVTYLAAGVVNSGTHFVSEWSMLSVMSRINYSYDGKYLFTATVRRDGSSKFGSNNKWGTFPSFSFGYNVSEEDFMKSLNYVSNLKLRAGYGISGNNQIGNYTHIGLLAPVNYVENTSVNPGLVPSNLSNDNLTWEKSAQINLGLDLGLFKDRVSITADIYKDKKTDLLLAVQLPSASGFYSSVQNVGDIENKGIELGLKTINLKGKNYEWTSSFTISHNENKVVKLATEGARIYNTAYQVTQVGYPIASFYLMNQTGIFQTPAEVASSPLQSPKVVPGDPKFEDITGDGKINASDKKVVGSPWPDYVWGFDNRFSYRNFTLSVSLNGSHGGETYFQGGEIIYALTAVQNQLGLANNRWVSPSQPGDGMTPRSIRNNYAFGFGTGTSRLLFDNSFVRVKNVNLGYNLPKTVISRIGLTSLSVYVDAANLFTSTKYPGYDPESSSSGDNLTSSGIDYMTYPLAKTFTFGIKLTL